MRRASVTSPPSERMAEPKREGEVPGLIEFTASVTPLEPAVEVAGKTLPPCGLVLATERALAISSRIVEILAESDSTPKPASFSPMDTNWETACNSLSMLSKFRETMRRIGATSSTLPPELSKASLKIPLDSSKRPSTPDKVRADSPCRVSSSVSNCSSWADNALIF